MTQWPLPEKLRHKNTLALFIYSGCISLIKLVSDATKHVIYRQGGRLVIFALGSVQAGVVYTGVLHCSFLTSSHFVWSLPKLSGMRKECVLQCSLSWPVLINGKNPMMWEMPPVAPRVDNCSLNFPHREVFNFGWCDGHCKPCSFCHNNTILLIWFSYAKVIQNLTVLYIC